MVPSSSASPSKKLLIADPKPKSDPICASSSSTTSPPLPPEKRTRDQPNLSDCHCCGGRINFTNPADRLQPLDSVWRIVLLCRKCRKNIQSGRTCSYCFEGIGNSGDYCMCSVCERKIHKKCVGDYGNCTPWCYSGAGLEGFRVCLDCWVPELLKKSIRVSRKSDNKAGSKDKNEAPDSSENVVQEAKCGVEKKIKRVSKAKDNVSRRGSEEMNGVDLDDGAFDLLPKKNVDSSKGENSNCSGAAEVVDDAALAIHLHRVINSSPRISRGNKSLVNLDSSDATWKGLFYERSGLRKKCNDGQKIRTCFDNAENGRMSQPAEIDSSIVFGRLGKGLLPYKRDRKRKIWQVDMDKNVVSESASSQQAELENLRSDDAGTRSSMRSGADRSEDSICASADKKNGDRFGHELVRYKRTRFKNKVCQVSESHGVSRGSNYFDNLRMVFSSDYCQPDDANLDTGCPIKGICEVILPSGICEAKQDRYHLKYKRIPGSKRDSYFLRYGTWRIVSQAAAPAISNSDVGHPMNSGELILPDGNCNQETDRFSFKYTKRAKRSKSGSTSESELNSDVFLNELKACATGLTKNCSAESRTLSDVSFDPFPIDLPK